MMLMLSRKQKQENLKYNKANDYFGWGPLIGEELTFWPDMFDEYLAQCTPKYRAKDRITLLFLLVDCPAAQNPDSLRKAIIAQPPQVITDPVSLTKLAASLGYSPRTTKKRLLSYQTRGLVRGTPTPNLQVASRYDFSGLINKIRKHHLQRKSKHSPATTAED